MKNIAYLKILVSKMEQGKFDEMNEHIEEAERKLESALDDKPEEE